MQKKYIAAIAAGLVVAIAGPTGYITKHNADVAHAKQVAYQKKVDAARLTYQGELESWRASAKSWDDASALYTSAQGAYDPVISAGNDLSSLIQVGGYDYD